MLYRSRVLRQHVVTRGSALIKSYMRSDYLVILHTVSNLGILSIQGHSLALPEKGFQLLAVARIPF